MPLSRSVIAIFVVAAAAASGAALAADAPSSPAGCPAADAKDAPVAYIKNPKWVHQPAGEDVIALYPTFEYRMHKTDHTVVDCAVAEDGGLQDCTVVDDKKPGKGFDKATLGLAKLYKMPPLATQPAFTGLPECVRKLGPPHVVIPMDWSAGG
ncbi:MAG TPA: hypothetical protein VIJ94_02290 [Caulobacteraceae bacterium]